MATFMGRNAPTLQTGMDYDDDMDYESEDGEVLEYETATLASLRAKEFTVTNSDGTLRCPLSPSRKKQAYAYKDLLQHATAVSVGKRGPEAAGQHSALKKFLESDLKSLATPPVERVLKVQRDVPRRREDADKLVCPWSVVVYNIDNRQRDSKQGILIGLGKSELKIYFADFNPDKVHVFWGPQGHLGMSVLQFGRALSGLKDAQALEKSFLDKDHGRRDYERNSASGNLGKDFYGWLAVEEDLKGRFGFQSSEIARYLMANGDLMDIGMVGDEMQKIHTEQVRQLAATVSKKDETNSDLRTEMEIIRRNAEVERLQLEELHKKELDAVRVKAQSSEAMYNQAMEKREAQLRQLDKELREKESNLKSAAERETQVIENRRRQEMVSKEQDKLKQKDIEKMKLKQKHEEEAIKLERKLKERAHNELLQLTRRQNMETEKQQLHIMLETELDFDRLSIKEDNGQESKTITELKEKLQELESNQEFNEDTINSLVLKERLANDEIANARKMAAKVMETLCTPKRKPIVEAVLLEKSEADKTKKVDETKNAQPNVGVKSAGSIDQKPWRVPFQRKYKKEWGMQMTTTLSEWEDRIRNSGYQPFKNVEVAPDRWKQVINLEDKELRSLREQFGEEVYNSVTTALMEIEEYNASGRYPIAVAWIFEQSRKATLEEVIAHLGKVIEAFVAREKPKKKVRS